VEILQRAELSKLYLDLGLFDLLDEIASLLDLQLEVSSWRNTR